MNFENLFVNPSGRTSRRDFIPALLVILAAILFYGLVVKGRTAQFCLLVLLFPLFVLHARRLHDMGHTAWLLAAPVLLLALTLGIRLDAIELGESLHAVLPIAALVVGAGFALWCCLGDQLEGQSEGQR